MIIKYLSSFVFILSVLLFSNVSLSGEIDFSDEALAKEILLENDWTCTAKDRWGEGVGAWRFKKINGKKVAGSVHMSYCPSQTGTFKGTLEKNKMKFSTQQPRPCANRSGELEFVHEDGKSVTAKGKYRFTSGSIGDKGTISCTHN